MSRPAPTSRERTFSQDQIIVSKTDLKGRITYANDVFCSVGLYEEKELLGQPHSMVRHPDMPRAVFHLLWQRLAQGEEIFAYVKNMAKNGDYYWVLAHVTPTRNLRGEIESYHSNRRLPSRQAIQTIEPIYQRLRAEEERHADRKQGMQSSIAILDTAFAQTRFGYDEFVLDLAQAA
jgi:PAS domain S-box-containing protein